jgi:hypothetical protein
MSIIYLVMSSEELADGNEYVETCRAFCHFNDAVNFRDHLDRLFKSDPTANETDFYVEKVQLSPAAYVQHNQPGATA